MWLYFDENGALIKTLEHGPAARVGTTDFQIFAYFEGVDYSVFNTATLKLVREDFFDSSHPQLLMAYTHDVPFVLNTNKNETNENVVPFIPGERYNGYLFDFARFSATQDITILLDTPGRWYAIITLYGSGSVISVQGVAMFNVQGVAMDSDSNIVTLDEVVSNIALEFARKSDQFIFVDSLSGTLSPEDLNKIKDNKINKIVYNNIVYYYSIKVNGIQRYFSVAVQKGDDTDYNEIDVDIVTGEYGVYNSKNKYLEDHINNTTVHITQAERNFWNNKVTTVSAGEELILTKD